LFAFLMFVYIRVVAKREGTTKAFYRVLPVLLIAVIGCVFLFVNFVLPVFEARSSEQTDVLTNRTGIWGDYVKALSMRTDVALWGCGAGNVSSIMKMVGRTTSVVPHNTYLEYIIQFGLFGMILLFVSWKNMFKQIKVKLNTYYILPLVAFLITSFGISVNSNDCPYILFALLSLPLAENNAPQILQARKRGYKYGKKALS